MPTDINQLAKLIIDSYEQQTCLRIDTEDLQLINSQAYFDEQFSVDNQYNEREPYDPVLPPSRPIFKITDFLTKIGQIEEVNLLISLGQFRANFSRFKMLRALTVNGQIAPEMHFGAAKNTLKTLRMNCPLETASTVLLSGISASEQQKILEIRDLSAFEQQERPADIDDLLQRHAWMIEHLDFSKCGIYVMDASLLLLRYSKQVIFSGNQVCRIEYLWNSYALDTVDLSFNQISELTNLHKSLGEVRRCFFRGNFLENIEELALLKGITDLDLSENLISDEQQIALVAKLPFLQSLFINGNPVFQSRKQIIAILERQIVLNGLLIDEDEIVLDKTKDKIAPISYERQLALRRMMNNGVNKNYVNYGNILLKDTREIIGEIGIDQFSVSTQNPLKMTDIDKTVLKYNVDALYEIQQEVRRGAVTSNVDSFLLAERANQAMLTSCIEFENKISYRPSGLYPFGTAYHHGVKFSAKKPFLDQYWQKNPVSDTLKYRTHYHAFDELIRNEIDESKSVTIEREHQVLPCQKTARVDSTLALEEMRQEDNISLIYMQTYKLEHNFEILLRDTAYNWIASLKPEFLSEFNAKYGKEDLARLMEQVGLHNIISIPVLTQLSEYYIAATVWSISRLMVEYALDLALLLMYDFFKRVLKHLGVEGSEQRADEELKRLKLKYQELKTKSELELLNRKEECEELKDPTDTPIAMLIQYMFENKLFDRRIGGMEDKTEIVNTEEAEQFINAKEEDGYKIYKFYDENAGKIIKVRRKQLENGDEGSDERIEDDEEVEAEDLEFKRKQVTKEELDRKMDMELYEPDSENFVKRLSVCVPFGDNQIYVDMREIEINLEEGKLTEFRANEVVKTENLRNLVTYIIPKTTIIESIYKCVILLFAEPEKQTEKNQEKPQKTDEEISDEISKNSNHSGVDDSLSLFGDSSENSDNNEQDKLNNGKIPLEKSIDVMPVMREDEIVRHELQIALPGVAEEQVENIIAHTLNLQTENSYDPLRTAHSFSSVPKQAFHSVCIYFLSSEPVQHRNMSQLSSYTELLELITLPIMKAYKPPSEPTFWGYCLRCSASFRAVESEYEEINVDDFDKSNCFTTLSEYKLQNQKETGDEVSNTRYRKIHIIQNGKSIPALITGYEEHDYYTQNYSYVRYSSRQGSLLKENAPLIACPHCHASANFSPSQLNLDIRRRVRAVEELQTGKELHLPGVDTDERKVNIETGDVIWETIPYAEFDIETEKILEVAQICGKPTIPALPLPDDIYYWIIERPSHLPMDRMNDFYSRLLEDPIERQILAEAFRTVNIPEPARRYLKLINRLEEEDVNYTEMLPEEEHVSDLESSSEESRAEAGESETESFEPELDIQEVIEERKSLSNTQEMLEEINFSYTERKIPRELFPFNIDEYIPSNSLYYTEFYDTNPKEVFFRGFIEAISDEWLGKTPELHKKLILSILNLTELDMDNFVGCWHISHCKAKEEPRECLMVLLKDCISFVFARPQQSLTVGKALRSYAEQFSRVTKPLRCLETITRGCSVELRFTKLPANYAIQSSVLSPMQQSENTIIPDTEELDYIFSDAFALVEITTALSHFMELQDLRFEIFRSLELSEDLANQENKIKLLIPLSFNRTIVVDSHQIYLAKASPGSVKAEPEFGTHRIVSDLLRIQVARIQDTILILSFRKEKDLSIEFHDWRMRAVACMEIYRLLDEGAIEVDLGWE